MHVKHVFDLIVFFYLSTRESGMFRDNLQKKNIAKKTHKIAKKAKL